MARRAVEVPTPPGRSVDADDRHARQRQVAGVGPGGVARLARSRVLIVGLGGLGCPAATYLAGAGVGSLTVCDADRVALTDLHRQTLYVQADVGRPKVEAAAHRLAAIDGRLRIETHGAVTAANAHGLVQGHDVVLDCTDDLEARYVLSDASARLGIPLVQAGLGAGDGEVAMLCGPTGPCYRCLHPAAQAGPTCATEGILGPLAGTVGSLQALWALQLLLGWPEPAAGTMLLLDGRTGLTQTVRLKRRPGCPAHMEDGPACPMPWNAPEVTDIAVHDFAPRRDEFFVLDVREPDEFEEGHIAGATLLPLGQLPRRMAEVPRNRPVVCVCAVGGRSARATDYLRQHGVQALNLRGGMRAWTMAGLR